MTCMCGCKLSVLMTVKKRRKEEWIRDAQAPSFESKTENGTYFLASVLR